MKRILVLTLVLAVACVGDTAQEDAAQDTAGACNAVAARETIERLGARLRNVSVLAPESARNDAMRQNYGQLVDPPLLDSWLLDPEAAPGRQVSSPWPQRIEIHEITTGAEGDCVVNGDVVLVTSPDTTTVVSTEGITVTLTPDGSVITAFHPAT